jgi:hypothetical protein
MSGLIDTITGLKFGAGLQSQTQIGTAGFDVPAGGAAPTSFFLLEDGVSYLLLEDGVSKLGLEN